MSSNEKKSGNNAAACNAVNSRIGGQAVMEGIMMRNDDRYAISVRKPDQNIETKVESTGSLAKNKWLKIPIVRGVYSFIGSLVTGISCLMFSATFFEEEEEGEKKPLTREEEEAKVRERWEIKEERFQVLEGSSDIFLLFLNCPVLQVYVICFWGCTICLSSNLLVEKA